MVLRLAIVFCKCHSKRTSRFPFALSDPSIQVVQFSLSLASLLFLRVCVLSLQLYAQFVSISIEEQNRQKASSFRSDVRVRSIAAVFVNMERIDPCEENRSSKIGINAGI